MSSSESQARTLARQLLAREAVEGDTSEGVAAAAERVFGRLHEHLARLIGRDGFRALLASALVRAQSQYASLSAVRIQPRSERLVDGLAEGLRAQTPAEASETVVVFVADFIALLGRFVGDTLAMGLVDQSWPEEVRRHANSGGGGRSGE